MNGVGYNCHYKVVRPSIGLGTTQAALVKYRQNIHGMHVQWQARNRLRLGSSIDSLNTVLQI